MSITDQRLELVKMILEDSSIEAEEEEVLHLLLQEHISMDSATEHESTLTFGQRSADALARFAGSWTFIIIFFTILMLWIVINAIILTKPYDPYPFILLNLILSCLASVQAPIIMMSQNRQEQKDRLRAKNDYRVNLKAEIIIEDIHQKMEALIEKQEELAERLFAAENQREEQ